MFLIYVDDICDLLEVSQSYAYGVIRKVNKCLEKKGFLTIRGRITSKSFCELYGYDVSETEKKLNEFRSLRKQTVLQ